MSNQKKNEKNQKIECMGCNEELPNDHTGIICLQNHNLCTECSKGFINLIFSEPQANMPPK